MALVVCFSGQIGSGKSSVSRRLADHLAWRRASFGDYLRAEILRQGGDPESRQALQDLGQALVDRDPEGFCRSVLSSVSFQPGGDLLLDGVRHTTIQRIIRRLVAPSICRLIFLTTDDEHRLGRVRARLRGLEDDPRAQAHRVEAELRDSLPAISDVVIDANRDLSDVVSACVQAIGRWREQ